MTIGGALNMLENKFDNRKRDIINDDGSSGGGGKIHKKDSSIHRMDPPTKPEKDMTEEEKIVVKYDNKIWGVKVDGNNLTFYATDRTNVGVGEIYNKIPWKDGSLKIVQEYNNGTKQYQLKLSSKPKKIQDELNQFMAHEDVLDKKPYDLELVGRGYEIRELEGSKYFVMKNPHPKPGSLKSLNIIPSDGLVNIVEKDGKKVEERAGVLDHQKNEQLYQKMVETYK